MSAKQKKSWKIWNRNSDCTIPLINNLSSLKNFIQIFLRILFPKLNRISWYLKNLNHVFFIWFFCFSIIRKMISVQCYLNAYKVGLGFNRTLCFRMILHFEFSYIFSHYKRFYASLMSSCRNSDISWSLIHKWDFKVISL